VHIEIGIIEPVRLAAANAAAAVAVAGALPAAFRAPATLVKAGLAAVAFSGLMQAWHFPVGPSELHLIGATTVYLLFGFPATVLGFAAGLLLQALLFEPLDLVHLGVNALSLILPLVAVHLTFGRRLADRALGERFTFARVLRLDAVYYAGVTAMVGFWLMVSTDQTAFADWGRWALAYAPVFVIEALISFGAVMAVRRFGHVAAVDRFTEVGRYRFA
jgi:ABC-type Co2+ transport system permease subunit